VWQSVVPSAGGGANVLGARVHVWPTADCLRRETLVGVDLGGPGGVEGVAGSGDGEEQRAARHSQVPGALRSRCGLAYGRRYVRHLAGFRG